MRKTVIRSPLDKLPLHVKQTLHGWLTTGGETGQGLPYSEIQRRLEAEFQFKTNTTSLCLYFQRTVRAAWAREASAAKATVKSADGPMGQTITIVIHVPNPPTTP